MRPGSDSAQLVGELAGRPGMRGNPLSLDQEASCGRYDQPGFRGWPALPIHSEELAHCANAVSPQRRPKAPDSLQPGILPERQRSVPESAPFPQASILFIRSVIGVACRGLDVMRWKQQLGMFAATVIAGAVAAHAQQIPPPRPFVVPGMPPVPSPTQEVP